MPLDRGLDWGKVGRKEDFDFILFKFLYKTTWDKLAETDQSETLQREGRILRAF